MKGGRNSYSNYTRAINDSSYNTEDSCNTINLIEELQNIQKEISNYSIDDVLKVTLDSDENIVVSGDQGICGYIISQSALKLRECLKKGKKFRAIVLKITLDSCEVRVKI